MTTEDLGDKANGDAYREALRACLQRVTGDSRRVLELRYRDDASRSEMAAATGRSEEGIKTLLRRAKAQLRDCIEQRRTR